MAREQLLELAAHQAQVQGKSLAQYLQELHAQAERKGEGTLRPRSAGLSVSREKYVYLTRSEVELLFEQITELRDRTLFGAMYYFGLRASEVGLLLRVMLQISSSYVRSPRMK